MNRSSSAKARIKSLCRCFVLMAVDAASVLWHLAMFMCGAGNYSQSREVVEANRQALDYQLSRTPREPQLIGGRWDGLTEHEAGQLVHRISADADSCWLEIVDPISGRGDRYEQFGQDWFWAGRMKERV